MKPILLATLAAGICAAQAFAPIRVEDGLLQGTSENGLSVYRGIPFAAPPVGDLRWRAPQPTAKWAGVKPADKFGPRCYQGGRGAPGVETSEDCLYLNVWSPASPFWFGFMAADSTPARLPNQITAGRISPKRVSCW